MNRIVWSLVFLFCCSVGLRAQEQQEGIRFFEGTFQEALDLAKRENKLVFLDCSARYCGGCLLMEKKVFPVKEVGDFFNANFISLVRKMDKEGEGTEIAKRYNIAGYPTWLFLNGDGYVVHMDAAYMEPEKFIALAKTALAAPRVSVEERFAKGERDERLVKEYLGGALKFAQADKVDRVLATLYREQGGKILQDKDYWRAFTICTVDPDVETALYVVKNWKELAKVHGEESVLQKIRNLYVNWSASINLLDGGTDRRTCKLNETKKAAYLQKIKDRKLPDYKMLQEEMNFLVLLDASKYEEACGLADRVLKNADARTIRNWAVFAERRVKGKELRGTVAGWVKRAMQMRQDEGFLAECQDLLNNLNQLDTPSRTIYPSMPIRGYAEAPKKGKK